MEHPLGLALHEIACDRHPADRPALTFAWADSRVERFAFGDLRRASEDVAAQLAEAGVAAAASSGERGKDERPVPFVRAPMRVAVVLPQCPLAPVVHLALSRIGAVAVPLSPLFGPDGLAPRLAASGAALAVVHASKAAHVREAAPGLALWTSDGRIPAGGGRAAPAPPAAGLVQFGRERLVERPMSMIFTSGTTAQPKAALLPHRVVAGRMPGFLAAHPGFSAADRFWSPADWAWIGGLHDSVFAPWAKGASVFAYERDGRFDPARAAALVGAHGVTAAFLPPTALRKWATSGAPAPRLRTLHTAGEPLPPAVHEWATRAFGVAPREVYGLTECAFLLVSRDGEPGVTGEPAPGHEVRVLSPTLAERAPGEVGEVCVRRGSPTMMLGYVVDDCIRLPLDSDGWFHTGDLARRDARGRITVLGRLDDVVKTSGYRVAPREVEEALLRHPAVDEVAVVGVPDAERGAVLKAFVKLAPGHGPESEAALAAHVRERLAPHETPRAFEFVDELPRTASGKVVRRALR